MDQAIIGAILVFFGAVAFCIVFTVLRSKACVQPSKQVPHRYSSPQRAGHQLTSLPLALQQSAHPKTQHRLFQLLNGDRRTAERLLSQVRQQHPGQAEHWYWEKVIFDLERDRRI